MIIRGRYEFTNKVLIEVEGEQQQAGLGGESLSSFSSPRQRASQIFAQTHRSNARSHDFSLSLYKLAAVIGAPHKKEEVFAPQAIFASQPIFRRPGGLASWKHAVFNPAKKSEVSPEILL